MSALCLASMQVATVERPPAASFLAELRSGWREFARHRWLQLLTVQFGLLNLVAFAPFVVLGAVAVASVPQGAQLWGLILSAVGLGGVAGGLLVLRVKPSRPGIAIEGATAALALLLALLAMRAPVAGVVLGGVVFGAAAAVLNVLLLTVIQASVLEALLSRVNSLITLVAVGSAPVGYALCGPFAQLVGLQRALGIGAAIIVASVALALGSREIRGFTAAQAEAPDAGSAT